MNKLLFVFLLFPSVCMAQYPGFKQVKDKKVVVIEKQEIQFEDTGIRVVGVAANLLGLDYYYRVNPGVQNIGYGANNLGYGGPVVQPQPIVTNQQSQSNELLERVLNKALEKLIDGIVKDCFGTQDKKTIPNTPTTPPPDRNTPTTPVTGLTQEVTVIFQKSCVGCHGKVGPEAGLSLSDAQDVSSLSFVQSSDILDRVTGGGGLLGSQVMPKDGQPLSDQEITTIRKWVREVRDGLKEKSP